MSDSRDKLSNLVEELGKSKYLRGRRLGISLCTEDQVERGIGTSESETRGRGDRRGGKGMKELLMWKGCNCEVWRVMISWD